MLLRGRDGIKLRGMTTKIGSGRREMGRSRSHYLEGDPLYSLLAKGFLPHEAWFCRCGLDCGVVGAIKGDLYRLGVRDKPEVSGNKWPSRGQLNPQLRFGRSGGLIILRGCQSHPQSLFTFSHKQQAVCIQNSVLLPSPGQQPHSPVRWQEQEQEQAREYHESHSSLMKTQNPLGSTKY